MSNQFFAENAASVPSGYFDPAANEWNVVIAAESLGLGDNVNVESLGFAVNQP
ncbi:MAG: hypothetical protein MUO77_09950 [Anaerolineales bacterium]|nr:hypothetical protein [Anaerolineales bacterium]